MQHVYILKEQAQNFLLHLRENPDLLGRMEIIIENVRQHAPAEFEALHSGWGRIPLVAFSNSEGSTFDGMCQALSNIVQIFVGGDDGSDALGDDLRMAFTDILGFPEIPQRGAPENEMMEFLEKTGGAGDSKVEFNGAGIFPSGRA